MPLDAAALAEAIRGDMPELIALYRDLHANPELSMEEVRTPALLAPMMRDLGFEVTEGVGGTGVVSVMPNGPGPVLMLRADMDGLPVIEQTDLPYASKVQTKARSGVETGVMHACGHDTHMAAFIGAARRLSEVKDAWSGTLVMVLQPGEETGEGARAMLDDGLFTRFPKPKYAVAFHDAAMLPAGVIGVTSGYALANVDSVDINVQGVGGHGAYPHTTRDSIVLGARIVTTLQTLVSREIDPQDPAVVTIGSFQGGAKHNIIPDEAKLQLTVRSYRPEVRQRLLRGIERIVRGESIAAGIPDDRMSEVTIREDEYTPATFNTETLAAHALSVFTQHFGAGRVVSTPAVMAGEDFGRYRLADPGIESLIFWVGGTPRDQWDASGGDHHKLPSLHSPFWAPDAEAVISTATEALTILSLDLLAEA